MGVEKKGTGRGGVCAHIMFDHPVFGGQPPGTTEKQKRTKEAKPAG